MTKNDFKELSINELKGDLLKALWYDAHDKWEEAHEVVQAHEGKSAYDRIHAYLHRKEGDKFRYLIFTDLGEDLPRYLVGSICLKDSFFS